MASRVVVTGMGVICSIGNNLQEFEINLRDGKSGLKEIQADRFDVSDPYFRSHQGCAIDQELYRRIFDKDVSMLGEISIKAIEEAIATANLDLSKTDPRKIGLCLGTSVGGSYPFMEWIKDKIAGREPNIDLLTYSTPNITSMIARQFGIRGPLSTISTACASGTNSIGRAFDLIRNNRVDYMIAGGVDVFTYLTFSGFNSLFALSRRLPALRQNQGRAQPRRRIGLCDPGKLRIGQTAQRTDLCRSGRLLHCERSLPRYGAAS